LRQSDIPIFVRHRSRDVAVLNEIFGGPRSRHCYEPPAAVAARLDPIERPRIVDLGANIGLFGAFALGRWPGATIRSFEPDPHNLAVLGRTVAAAGGDPRWSVEPVAVSNRAGEMAFEAGLHADSHLVPDGRHANGGSIAVTTVDLLAEPPHADLLKMDIEGGEWPILADARIGDLAVDTIVLEWHAGGCPDPVPHTACLRLLGAAGYNRVEEVSTGTESGLLWAWREARF
jgi:FkbM family methyltransferase